VLIGLAAGLLAAVVFGGLAVVQAAAVRLYGLASWRVAAVAGLYVLGWLLHLLSIARLPLYLAQVTIVLALAVTALLAAFVVGERLRRRHWAGVVGLVAGLAVLALAAGDVGHSRFGTSTTVLLLGWLLVNALAGLAASRASGEVGGVLLGVLAGCAFAGSPVASRALVGFRLDVPTVLAVSSIGLFGLLGFVLYSLALRRTSVTAATAPMTLLQTVGPAVIGVVVLHDQVRAGWAAPGLAAFAVSVASAVVLCGAPARLDLHQGLVGTAAAEE
jgi:drug/metabolite transporter (DMT)-like permease